MHSTAPSRSRWRTTSQRQASRKLRPAPRWGRSTTATSAAAPAAASASTAASAVPAAVGGWVQGRVQRAEDRQGLEAVDSGEQGHLPEILPPAAGDEVHQSAVGLLEPVQVLVAGAGPQGRL